MNGPISYSCLIELDIRENVNNPAEIYFVSLGFNLLYFYFTVKNKLISNNTKENFTVVCNFLEQEAAPRGCQVSDQKCKGIRDARRTQ